MPAMLLYIIDTDLFTEPELYLPSEIEASLRWIFSTCDEVIKNRKRSMPQRSIAYGEPLLYVMKAIPRFDNGTDLITCFLQTAVRNITPWFRQLRDATQKEPLTSKRSQEMTRGGLTGKLAST